MENPKGRLKSSPHWKDLSQRMEEGEANMLISMIHPRLTPNTPEKGGEGNAFDLSFKLPFLPL